MSFSGKISAIVQMYESLHEKCHQVTGYKFQSVSEQIAQLDFDFDSWYRDKFDPAMKQYQLQMNIKCDSKAAKQKQFAEMYATADNKAFTDKAFGSINGVIICFK